MAHETAGAVMDPRYARALHDPERLSMLAAGETALQRGDAAAAQQAFEQAASRLHAADSEMGLVRAAMQDGRYREALALCAHTAGAHRDDVQASALYAWLLALCNQRELGGRLLAEARALAPDDAVLRRTAALFSDESAVPDGDLLAAPCRLAPRAWPALPLPAGARVNATALLLPGGRQALAPLQTLADASPRWLRSGLGQTVRAQVVRRDEREGVALLALDQPLPSRDIGAYLGRPAAPGRPCFALFQMPRPDTDAAWPLLRTGFAGRVSARTDRQALGIALPAVADAAALFDVGGAVTGLAVREAGGGLVLSSLQAWLPSAPETPASGQRAPLQADEVYELGLRTVLQVMAA